MVNIPVLEITVLEIAVLNSAKNCTLLNTVQDYAKKSGQGKFILASEIKPLTSH